MKGLLNGTVKLVMLQFNFSNIEAMPPGLFEKKKETVEELIARRSGVSGVLFLDPTPNVSVLQFLSDLAGIGYKMVDAFFKIRINASGQNYLVARFVFASKDNLKPEGEFAKQRDLATKALAQICEQAMWSVMAFLNPFFSDGELVADAHSISVNLAKRNPLVDKKGNVIMRGSVPLQPKLLLRITDDDVKVVPA